ncbi:MAG TPA: hypothetical protein VGX28_12495 [Frankiaceae bacterium]|jgi:hypothetical protein|nr:hypothetical protein [Frankiaceae bacterium]
MKRTLSLKRESLAVLTTEEMARVFAGESEPMPTPAGFTRGIVGCLTLPETRFAC